MEILFTRSRKIGSRLIRWVTGEDISHVALLTEDGVIVHARFDGVDVDGPEFFTANNEIVRRYRYVGFGDVRFLTRRALMLEGSKYDMLAFFFLGIRLLLRRSLGVLVPAIAARAQRGQYICTEFVDTIIGEKESNCQLTPGQFERQLQQLPQWELLNRPWK